MGGAQVPESPRNLSLWKGCVPNSGNKLLEGPETNLCCVEPLCLGVFLTGLSLPRLTRGGT